MTKSFALCFFLSFMFLTSLGRMKMAVEARYCTDTWECDRVDRCSDDCKHKHNGMGICYPPIGPYVPSQCVCIYNC
ncbi:Putative defensin-like protein 184 [Linum perenne]